MPASKRSQINRWPAVRLMLVTALILTSACAQKFPRPGTEKFDTASSPAESLSGHEIFRKTFEKHGGLDIDRLNDLNVSLVGNWKFLITRIQPLVTDHKYRVESEERIFPSKKVYAANYSGPKGSKQVFYSPETTRVFYDNSENIEQDVLQSTALTANSFYIFLLGPLAFHPAEINFIRLRDKAEKGRKYFRVYAELKPGIGESPRDEVVLWIDTETLLTYRVHITLEGYRTTRGAHVDVTFLDYKKLEQFTFPTKFHERVLGPISIDAHAWQLTGLDINRGIQASDVQDNPWSEKALNKPVPLP